MQRKKRHHRPKHRVIVPWPEELPEPAVVAARVRYVGSPEHKGAWSPHHAPKLRSDASKCPPHLSNDLDSNSSHLQRGIEARCVGRDFEDGFPKYIWVWLEDQVWEARHMRGPLGTYKAYGPLEPVDWPLDFDHLLHAARAVQEED